MIKKKFLKNCIKEEYSMPFMEAFPKDDFTSAESKLVEIIIDMIKEEITPRADDIYKKTGDMEVAKLFIELAP